MIFPKPLPESLDLNGITVKLRRNNRARRVIVKINHGSAELVLPRRASLKTALAFLYSKENWVRSRLAAQPQKIPLKPGATIPLLGNSHNIVYGGMRGKPSIGDSQIMVYGDEKLTSSKVKKVISTHLKNEISQIAKVKAAELGVKFSNISIRSTTSRWGSCSSSGNLSFCWKLAFAPYHVLEYLVCHEVAHLAEMNHSKKFWDKVSLICPSYEASENWLKRNGSSLHLYD